MVSISLFYCCQKLFILMSIWVNGKSLMKHNCLKKKNVIATKYGGFADIDYMHAKRVCEDFEIEDFGEYSDLYVQSATLLLADVFENFRNMYLELYLLDPAGFLTAQRMSSSLKKG